MKTPPDKTISFTFVSHPEKDASLRWTARLTFPPGAMPDTVLPIEVRDGLEIPVPSAVFEFAGRRLSVVHGQTSLTYAAFIRGKHETALWLHRPGKPPIPGGLTFA